MSTGNLETQSKDNALACRTDQLVSANERTEAWTPQVAPGITAQRLVSGRPVKPLDVLALQRLVGNQAVLRLLARRADGNGAPDANGVAGSAESFVEPAASSSREPLPDAVLGRFELSSGGGPLAAAPRTPLVAATPALRRSPKSTEARDGVGPVADDLSRISEPRPAGSEAGVLPRISLAPPATNAPTVRRAWYNVDIPFTNYQFDPSLEGIKTAANVVKDTAASGLEWIVDEIKSLVSSGIDWLKDKWNSLQEFASSAFDSVKNSFQNIIGTLQNPLGFLADAILNFDPQAVARAWAKFSGLITTVSNGFKALTDGLLEKVNKAWGGINGFATSVLNRVESLTQNFIFKKLPDAVQRIAFNVIDGLKSVWKGINDGWTKLFGQIKSWIDGAVDKVFSFVRRALSFGINVVIAGIVEFGKLILFLKDLFSNPRKYVGILAQRSVQAFDGVEGRFAGLVAQHFGGGRTAAPARDSATRIQRQPAAAAPAETKTSAGWSEIGHGVAVMMGKKWEAFKANPLSIVTGLLMDMFLPIVGNVKDVIQLFTDIKKVVTAPMSADSLQDLWTSLLKILDIPILIYHTVVSILMRSLMLPLIVATFIPHPLVKAIAAAVGYGLLGAFVQAEVLNLAQKLALLKTGLTNQAEKGEAYNGIADSLIALAMAAVITLIMLILQFIANIMKGVYGFIKGKVFRIEPGPAEGKGTAPDAEGKGTAPPEEVINGEKVVRTDHTSSGHDVKVTEKGRCLVCTTCEEIEAEFRELLQKDTPEIKDINSELDAARKMPNGPEKSEMLGKLKSRVEEISKKDPKTPGEEPAKPEPAARKLSALRESWNKLDEIIRDVNEKLGSPEASDLRADPTVKDQLTRIKGLLNEVDRERLPLKPEVDSTLDAAKDPELSDAAAEDAEKLQPKVDELQKRAEDLQKQLDERLEKQKADQAAKAERSRLAKKQADAAEKSANHVCDDTDGTNHPDATVKPGTTEAAIGEEIETGKPLKSKTGHVIKARQAVSALEWARGELVEARPQIEDSARLKTIDQTIARIDERVAALKGGVREWAQRATSHPDVWNSDGTSKVTPDFPPPDAM